MKEVTLEYVVLLHDLISAYHEKLSEVLSPTVAETFRGGAVDRIVSKLGLTKDKDGDSGNAAEKNVVETLRRWGTGIQIVEVGDQLICDISCPVARDVHPLLSSSHPQCPLATLVVGLVRSQMPHARIESSLLTENGVKFRINFHPPSDSGGSKSSRNEDAPASN